MPLPNADLDPEVIAQFRAAQTPAELAALFDPPRSTPRARRTATERTLKELLGE